MCHLSDTGSWILLPQNPEKWPVTFQTYGVTSLCVAIPCENWLIYETSSLVLGSISNAECVMSFASVGGISPLGHVILRVELASRFRFLDFLEKWILDIFVTTVSKVSSQLRTVFCCATMRDFSLGRPTILFVPSNFKFDICAECAERGRERRRQQIR
jgi:hypothetical protein